MGGIDSAQNCADPQAPASQDSLGYIWGVCLGASALGRLRERGSTTRAPGLELDRCGRHVGVEVNFESRESIWLPGRLEAVRVSSSAKVGVRMGAEPSRSPNVIMGEEVVTQQLRLHTCSSVTFIAPAGSSAPQNPLPAATATFAARLRWHLGSKLERPRSRSSPYSGGRELPPPAIAGRHLLLVWAVKACVAMHIYVLIQRRVEPERFTSLGEQSGSGTF